MTSRGTAPSPPRWRRKIVFVCPRIPELGGGGSATEVLSKAFTQAGAEVAHVTLVPGIRPPSFPTLTVFDLGAAHRAPAFRSTSGIRARARGAVAVMHKRLDRTRGLRRLRRTVESLDARDVVVFTNVLAKVTLDESGYRRSASSPIFIGQHHSSFHGGGSEWERGPMMRHFDDLDLFVALTAEDAQLFRSVVRAPCSSVPNIARILDHTSHQKRPIAVALARYEREKRLDLMISAFADATDSTTLHGWQLHLYGEGSLRSELADHIDRAQLRGRVKLMGRTDEVELVLQTAAVNLLTSEFEGFPMSVLEASAMGIPTVAFDCSPGVGELVSSSTGALVPPGDLTAYSAALRDLLMSADSRAAKGAAARASMAPFSDEAVIARWLTLIGECEQRRAAGARHPMSDLTS